MAAVTRLVLWILAQCKANTKQCFSRTKFFLDPALDGFGLGCSQKLNKQNSRLTEIIGGWMVDCKAKWWINLNGIPEW